MSNLHNAALIIIDIQNDFCPEGALAVSGGNQIIPMVNSLMSRFKTVVLTQDWHPATHKSFAQNHPGGEPFTLTDMPYGPQVLWPTHCVQGTSGAEFHKDLDVNSANMIIRKGCNPEIDSYSAFYENDQTSKTGLHGYLGELEVDQVYLCGLALDFCVYYSAIDARKCGYNTTVISDCCRAIDLDGSLLQAQQRMEELSVRFIESKNL